MVVTTDSIQSNVPLKPYTTFKIGGPARFFTEASTPEQFRRAFAFAREQRLPIFILGGGSNILVSDDGFDGLVVHPVRSGFEVEDRGDSTFSACIQAGEMWDQAVEKSVERELWGIENLSHIPGQAGAALVQNIGAYGQQVSDVFESADVMELNTGVVRTLGPSDCRLGYRTSIFNSDARGKYLILSLRLRLSAYGQPNLTYPDVREYFRRLGVGTPGLAEIRRAIITIRDRKFPFPREERGGNVGSFFKNLQLRPMEFEALRARLAREFAPSVLERLQEIRQRSLSDLIKIPSAFLIDICGLKGFRIGGAEVHPGQPLVLMNCGHATARDVLALARHVQQTVYSRTGMTLALEPQLVGFSEENPN